MARDKLNDLKEHFDITFDEVRSVYSSKTCSDCGFFAKAIHSSQSKFSCRSCGHEINADVNVARNLKSGFSALDRSACITKAESLRLTVQRRLERVTTGDPVIFAKVLGSSYYRTAAAALDVLMARNSQPPHLVADVSAG
ncbi:zinc ribbon domain-containing protein [Sulfitobacter guttiformis]|uniref:zinc ribbon domain-containing protein n=1 Tax=Sulfitobacter guttiformis TaxID=74349 RepID=UPI00046A1258|nr:zinc ribbon domain-containing protein [Sulfitobacter guttiformis]KIN74573.1 Transposon, transposase [Sulfitobacter guttiformis KCTC 32187]